MNTEANHEPHPSPRTRLRLWFAALPGRLVLAQELHAVRQVLPNLFGYHIVQIGHFDGVNLLSSSRISHHVVANIEGDVQAAQLGCHAGALPFAADSVDVLVLAHVLEFEDDPHQVLREVERVLIGEGHVAIFGFNPFSLFGLWKLFAAWRGEPPWSGRFIGLARAKDWLRLLGFEIVRAQHLFFRPPLVREGWLRRLAFLERLGAWAWPWLGGAYCLVGKKQLVPLTPIRAQWKLRRHLIAAGVTEPSARRGSYEQD